MNLEKEQCSTETLPSGRVSKIIQIHPSLNCNLFCKHCYSSSAPGIKEGLDVDVLIKLTSEAKDLGYNVISMSGGEPFMYRYLYDLLSHTASAGYFNSVTSNAMLLQSASAKKILQHVNLIAVSIDGQEEQHDEVRGLHGAYKKMLEGVAFIKDHIKTFGFIHTVMPDSWKQLTWLTSFAVGHGASLLHLHPLEITGRARENYYGSSFTAEELYKTYIAHYYLQTLYEKEIFIQLDLLHKDNIVNNPHFIFHEASLPELSVQGFSSVFKELIIDEKGDILPIAHGCSRYFKLGNINDSESLQQMIVRFMETRFEQMMKLFSITYNEIVNNSEREIVNWSELVINNSYRFRNSEEKVLVDR